MALIQTSTISNLIPNEKNMIICNNELYEITTDAIVSDIINSNANNSGISIRIDIFQHKDHYLLFKQEVHDVLVMDLKNPLSAIKYKNIEVIQKKTLSAFLSYEDVMFSQKLLEAVIEEDQDIKFYDYDSKEPLGVLAFTIRNGDSTRVHHITKGISVLDINEPRKSMEKITNYSGGMLGAYINEFALIYKDKSDEIKEIKIADLNHKLIQKINKEGFIIANISIEKIESYLGRKIPQDTLIYKNGFYCQEITLPTGISKCTSMHGLDYMNEGFVTKLKIQAKYLGSTRRNGKKYTLYGNENSFLFIAHDEKPNKTYYENFEYLEFKDLNYIFSYEFYTQVSDHMKDNLLNTLFSMGIETHTQFIKGLHYELIADVKSYIDFGMVTTKDKIDNVFIIGGDEIFNKKCDGTHVVIFSNPYQIDALVGTNDVYQFKLNNSAKFLNFLNTEISDQAEEKSEFMQEIVNILIDKKQLNKIKV
jgi:hypothetical protein